MDLKNKEELMKFLEDYEIDGYTYTRFNYRRHIGMTLSKFYDISHLEDEKILDDMLKNIDQLELPKAFEMYRPKLKGLIQIGDWGHPILYDEDVCIDFCKKIKLMPVYYRDDIYLVGVDTNDDANTVRFEAFYIFMTQHVPADGMFIDDEEFFRSVLGDDLYDTLLDMVKVDEPIVHLKLSLSNKS